LAKGKKLTVAFIDDEKRVYSVDMATPEELDEGISVLSSELKKRVLDPESSSTFLLR